MNILTGKNKITKEFFKNEVNLNINFQLTKQKREVLKVVGEAKKSRRIQKYGTDQNGRMTVRVHRDSPWAEVTSREELDALVVAAGPPATVNTRARRSGR